MKRLMMILLSAALLLLCACGGSSISADLKSSEESTKTEAEEAAPSEEDGKESGSPEADSAEAPQTETAGIAGEELRAAWMDAIDESGDTPKAPDLAAIYAAVLAESPVLTDEEFSAAVLAALESGDYTMTELPESDGTDEAYLDALEVMLARIWVEELSKLDLEPVEIEWGG